MDDATRQQAIDRLKALQVEIETDLANATEAGTVALDGSFGRISRIEALQRQQAAREQNRQREERLVRIQSAFARISQGSYGLCGRCRQPIAPERLEAAPDAVLCIRCAGRRGG